MMTYKPPRLVGAPNLGLAKAINPTIGDLLHKRPLGLHAVGQVD